MSCAYKLDDPEAIVSMPKRELLEIVTALSNLSAACVRYKQFVTEKDLGNDLVAFVKGQEIPSAPPELDRAAKIMLKMIDQYFPIPSKYDRAGELRKARDNFEKSRKPL